MLGFDVRTARAAWTVLLVAGAVAVVYLIRGTLLIFVAALLLAYLLAPLVGFTHRLTPRKFPRVLSLAAVYVLLLALIGVFLAAVAGRVLEEAGQLAESVPKWAQSPDPLGGLAVPVWMEEWKVKVVDSVRAELAVNAREMVPLIGRIGQRILALVGNLGFLVLVPVLSFFFLKDAAAIRERILSQLAGTPRFAFIQDVLSDIHLLLGQYIRALLILAAATVVVYGGLFLAIGLPYAVLLAALAGVLEFIPMVGPFTAGVVIVLVALLSGHSGLAVWIVVLLLGYRLFQDYVLQPLLMSQGVELHPLWVIFGVLAGEQIGGVAGMFLSIPVLATLRVVYVRFLKAHRMAPGTAD
jgi:predicted PurR-regulated permease PerM